MDDEQNSSTSISEDSLEERFGALERILKIMRKREALRQQRQGRADRAEQGKPAPGEPVDTFNVISMEQAKVDRDAAKAKGNSKK